ncbi:hypothetical protein LTR92_006629 [Exophiala xenobiotica]|nr:hypothetical protein LTR92_006629 [Exophiala xenobiotica]KAK5435839.1 hypothetical protein LTR18_009841 [Exophiala xenobiotica]KAK5555541.1 hypothetical protein LTR46_006566 [Exophiala xenobiotica]
MSSQQDNQTTTPSLPISPALIVGIVILVSFAVTIAIASIFGYCRTSRSASNDAEAIEGGDVFNPNRPRPAGQIARMKEVRWVNNMYAWERARNAKKEVGEVRPTTLLLGRPGQERNWDEWSSIDTGESSSGSGRQDAAKKAEDCTGAAHFYNTDDPYAPSSQQRLSRLAPPSARGSYQSNRTGLPHFPSLLLPQPVQRDLVRSPLRHEYQPRDIELKKKEHRIESEMYNSKIAINAGIEDISRNTYYDPNFEHVALDSGAGTSQCRVPASSSKDQHEIPMPDEPYPQLPVRPLTPGSVIVYSENERTAYERDPDYVEMSKNQEVEHSSNNSQESVKGMIQEWEKVNGSFGRP